MARSPMVPKRYFQIHCSMSVAYIKLGSQTAVCFFSLKGKFQSELEAFGQTKHFKEKSCLVVEESRPWFAADFHLKWKMSIFPVQVKHLRKEKPDQDHMPSTV